MRKLQAILVVDAGMYPADVLALDENGELWFGSMEATDDGRRMINWSPVNTPHDGAGLSDAQLSFYDRWEKEARERLKADDDIRRKALSLETQGEAHTSGTGEESEDSPDDRVEDGEGSDPGL